MFELIDQGKTQNVRDPGEEVAFADTSSYLQVFVLRIDKQQE